MLSFSLKKIRRFSLIGISLLALVPVAAATAVSINSNFNATAIASGNFIWFSVVGHISGSIPSTRPFEVHLTDIQFTITPTRGTDRTPILVSVPNAEISFGPTGTVASTSFGSGFWTSTVAAGSGNVFMDAVAFRVPAGIDVSAANPVRLTADVSTNASSSFTLAVQWAAAVYSSGCTPMGSTSTYGSINVQTVGAGSRSAGSPNACISPTSFLLGGARGGGGSNFTGSLSGTSSIIPSTPLIPIAKDPEPPGPGEPGPEPDVVPEPGTLSLCGVGILTIAGRLWRGKLRDS